MNPPQPDPSLLPFLSAKDFEAALPTGRGDIHVSVRSPSLADRRMSVWGDWRPMVTCVLEDDDRVQVAYGHGDGRLIQHEVRPPCVRVVSPMCHVEREQTPFVLEIEDTERCVRLRAWMNERGLVVRTNAEVMLPGVDVELLLFQGGVEPKRSRGRRPPEPTGRQAPLRASNPQPQTKEPGDCRALSFNAVLR